MSKKQFLTSRDTLLSKRGEHEWPPEAREAVARAIYECRHKGLRNIWPWNSEGLDQEHPGVRAMTLAQADAALAALAPFIAAERAMAEEASDE